MAGIKKISTIIKWIRQPSTWQGITMVLGALGISLQPQVATAILTAGGLIVGLISILKDDGTGEKAD